LYQSCHGSKGPTGTGETEKEPPVVQGAPRPFRAVDIGDSVFQRSVAGSYLSTTVSKVERGANISPPKRQAHGATTAAATPLRRSAIKQIYLMLQAASFGVAIAIASRCLVKRELATEQLFAP
jgi:hypothetical protein